LVKLQGKKLALITEKSHTATLTYSPLAKMKDYAAFVKLRLSSLVLISALAGYLIAVDSVDWMKLFFLMLGGFMVTGSSNGINQIIERELDKLMDRTKNRPLPTEKMNVAEGIAITSFLGIFGIFILWYFLNPLSGILGALALLLYTAIYTPLKRITPFAVFVGAFPGAIPPMLGYVAATGTFGLEPGVLFAIQFIWQFPHFWAIAWKVDEDYNKAGFKLLPSKNGKDKSSAFQILVYCLFLIPISLLPLMFNFAGILYAIIALGTGVWFLIYAVKLFISCSDKHATQLMFASFLYLPIVLIAYVIDKI
jgi:heme o synthase